MLKQTVQTLQIRKIGQLSFEDDGQLFLAFLKVSVSDGKNDLFCRDIDALCSSKSVI